MDPLAWFEWFLNNPGIFVSALIGMVIGIFISQKYIAPRIFNPEIASLNEQIKALGRDMSRMSDEQALMRKTHERDMQGLLAQNKRESEKSEEAINALQEKLEPFEKRMAQIAAEAFGATRAGSQ